MSAAHDHHDWCDTAECFLGNDGDGDYSSHFGVPTSPTIDKDDCMEWRCVPSGVPEIQIRPIDFTGSRGVEINAGSNRTVQSTSGSVGVSWLTPSEARELAALILTAADLADGGA